MTENKAPPALGTPEAAVRSCVSLLSMLFSQPEDAVAYYLDLYYQVRCAYERAGGPSQSADPTALPDGASQETDCHANAAAPARNDAENGGPPRASAPTESAKEGGGADKSESAPP